MQKFYIFFFLLKITLSFDWIGKWEVLSANSTDDDACPIPSKNNFLSIKRIDDEYIQMVEGNKLDYKLKWNITENYTKSCGINWCYEGMIEIERTGYRANINSLKIDLLNLT